MAGSASAATGHASSTKAPRIAYLSFAVANSYDAPMLAAAKKAAKKGGATIQVFDANNDPKKQLAQLQTATSSGQYDAIIVQPIFGTGLLTAVKAAIAKGIKVVALDQILGPKLSTNKSQVKGLSGSIVQVPTTIGSQLGKLTVRACTANKLNPCNVGYLYDIKASALDIAIRKAYVDVVKSHPEIKQVADGQSFFTPANGLKAFQTMLQSAPSMNLLVGSDQGIEGAVQVASKDMVLVGYGGSEAAKRGIASGRWFGSVWQVPATEGRLAAECAVSAVKTGKACKTPNLGLPVVTKANVSKYSGEWPG
ncbi:MAG TPA: sugar ABC transporter substrate-binding protein [Solirubrobacteraceae bacterium]|nr:sugar ABC transporter substrate-binding protein [Solirubrobacteraceae bacterium]